ncbi:MAG: LysM peptidoglycan-binding domain-containing protein [Proteobacteria bacterium]|jgi:membrane-bound lytic murein transglycosylase D|nr:LysM peptidoglycan-binding domain-containing protein [Pseudomonadota bacterium]
MKLVKTTRWTCSLFAVVILTSCASRQGLNEQDDVVQDSETPFVQINDNITSYRASEPNPPQVVNEELETIPVEMNPLVEKWVNYFQGRGRPHMERYLARSNRYIGLMKKILRQNGLPEDLIYIALIESGFSSKATSRAAAVGYWQFIRPTGKRYGLEINSLVDERRDPVLSTQAAAEYFKGLYSVFGSWYLAMASYNVGENRVKREVMNHYTRDFWELARKKRFPKETINYVPKYIAAKLIGKNPAQYGFTDVDYLPPIEFDQIHVERPVNLKQMADRMGVEYDDLKQLNPKFKGEIAPMKGTALMLRVPPGKSDIGLQAARSSFVEKVEYVADAGETQIHRVKSGESLYTIAKKYRTTVAWLRDANELKAGRKLRIGQRLQVPDRTVASSRKTKPVKVEVAQVEKKEDTEKANVNPEIVTAQGVFYIVQPGDTLSAIADDYDSSVLELRKMNKMKRGSVLRAGMRLKVPKDDGLPSLPDGRVASRGRLNEPTTGIRERSPSSAASQRVVHVVRKGENLTTIAKRHGVSVHAIKQANNLNSRAVIRVGSKLVIPKSSPSQSQKAPVKVHVVRRGENLTTIAEKYNVSVRELQEKNEIKRGEHVLIGSRLQVPLD